MVAFFAFIYYAALRPEEAVDLREPNLTSLLADDWGEMLLTNADPRTGSHWTDDGQPASAANSSTGHPAKPAPCLSTRTSASC